MSKEYEKARVKIKKEFEEKLKDLDRLKKIEVEYNRLKVENDSLKQENEQLRDWVERLLEYCDMSEEDLKSLKDNLSVAKSFDSLVSIMKTMSYKLGL